MNKLLKIKLVYLIFHPTPILNVLTEKKDSTFCIIELNNVNTFYRLRRLFWVEIAAVRRSFGHIL